MVRTTNSDHRVAEFYDTLAPDYDAMTGFEKRFATEEPYYRRIVETHGITSAVDAGCGTGFHSLLLAQLGVDVTAADISRTMLEKAVEHATQLNVQVATVESDFPSLAQELDRQFDAVFCLGNSLPHLLTEDELRDSLLSFRELLAPKGFLFAQLLNYDRILKSRERVQNVKEIGDATFVRFYEYEKESIRFNILKLEKKDDAVIQSLSSVHLRPIRKAELESMLIGCGFTNVSFFGGIAMEPFAAESSKDLFVIASR